MLTAIMSSPDFAEVMFLVSMILFVVAFVVRIMVKPVPVDFVLVAAGLAVLAFAFLAL